MRQMTQKPLHQVAPEISEYWTDVLVLSFSPKEKLGSRGFLPNLYVSGVQLMERVLHIPTGFDVAGFTCDQDASLSISFRFLARGIVLCIVVESVCLWGEEGPGLLFCHLPVITVLNLFFITIL